MSTRQAILLTTAGAALITLSTLGPVTAASLYSITDLSTLPSSSSSIAIGINDPGQVVGTSITNDMPFRAFFWENGVMTDLGTLGGSRSFVGGINNSGQVVGKAETGEVTYDDSPISHAFLWSKSAGMTDLTPTREDSLINTGAENINDAGQVIGSTENNNAFLWENGVITDFCQSGQCDVYDINNSGQVVGGLEVVLDTKCDDYNYYYEGEYYYCYDIATAHAHLWENGKRTDLGTIGNSENRSVAVAINDLGQIVGQVDVGETDFRAVLWDNGKIADLGTLGATDSIALDINNSGKVVGRSAINSENHAFLWDSTNGMQDLNGLIPDNSGWLLSEARAINKSGQIVGSGKINGKEHAFLLTPGSKTKAVPESTSALGLLAFGTFGAGWRLFRKQKAAVGTKSNAS